MFSRCCQVNVLVFYLVARMLSVVFYCVAVLSPSSCYVVSKVL